MTDCKKIAIIGWGSLIWCPKSLHKHIGEWQTGGPCLPIEFSRISCDERLTLVIDEKNGEVIPTRFTEIRICNLEDAIAALAKREGVTKKYIKYKIGFVDRQKAKAPPKKFLYSETVEKWLECTDFDAAIWTALKSNFKKKANLEEKEETEFSVEAATKYLQELTEDKKDLAREYIENAPPEVCTPLRRHLYATGWLKR